MREKVWFYVLITMALMSCEKEITYPSYQSGEAPLFAGGNVASDFVVSDIPQDILRNYNIDAGYYSKYTSVWGIPIVSSAEVDDIYLQNTAELVSVMLSDESLVLNKAVQIRNLLFRNMLRISIFPAGEIGTKQLPEFRTFVDAAAYGATREIPVMGFSTLNVTECGEGMFHNDLGRIKQGNSLPHEIMHSIHNLSAEKVSPGFNNKLKKAYQYSQNNQIWEKGNYINANYEEYLAEGAEIWFNWHPYHAFDEEGEIYFPEQEDLKEIDTKLYEVLSLLFQQDKEVMKNITFASPKVIFRMENIQELFGYDYSELKVDLYGDNEVIRTQTLSRNTWATTFIIPDPSVSYISFENYKFKATLFYDDDIQVVKEYKFSQEELINMDGFPSNINLQGTWLVAN